MYFLKLGYEVHIAAPYDGYENKIANIGCKVTKLHMNPTSINPLNAAYCIIQFYKIINTIKPSIILSFTIMNNIFCGICTRITKTPFIPNVTGLGTAFLSSQFLASTTQLLYKVAFKNAEIVFFQNSFDQSLFIDRRLVTEGQANLLPGSGINLNDYTEIPLKKDRANTILMASRIIKDKGVDEFLEASRRIKLLYPKCQFILVGQYDDHDKRKINIHKLNKWLQDGIGQYLGFSNDVSRLISEATVVVLPSYREGLPRIILEAAATGRPCITSDAPGCRDAVEDCKTGLLCKPRDSNDLSRKMIEFLELPFIDKLKMGTLARKKIEKEFSVVIIVKKYSEAVHKIIETYE